MTYQVLAVLYDSSGHFKDCTIHFWNLKVVSLTLSGALSTFFHSATVGETSIIWTSSDHPGGSSEPPERCQRLSRGPASAGRRYDPVRTKLVDLVVSMGKRGADAGIRVRRDSKRTY